MNQLSFDTFLENAKKRPPIRIAAAGPAKEEVLRVLKRLQEEGLADLTLIGETSWIYQMAFRAGLNMSKVELISEPILELPAAQVAIDEVRKGKAQVLMNGYVSSVDMLQASMDLKKGIRKNRNALSQLSVLELPGFSKLLYITDSGIHAKPNALGLQDILENTLEYLKKLGMEEIRVVVLKGTWILEGKEKVKAQTSLMEMTSFLEELQGKYPGLVLSGPMTLEESMAKEIPDVFLVPDAEAGQILSHALSAFAGGKAGHIILGGKVPLVLTANNPNEEYLWRSALLALNATLG